MADVAVIGCGNIGTRLIQSVSNITAGDPMTVYGVEPNEAVWDLARQRFNDQNAGGHEFVLSKNADALPDILGLLIVSVDARNRLAALTAGLEASRPSVIVLEKVLFTRRSDYSAARELIAACGASAYVNCTRNVWPGYQKLRKDIRQVGAIKRFTVTGADWNLSSNAIHFLAAFEYLAEDEIVSAKVGNVDVVRDSKRAGYREMVGTLQACSKKGAEISLTSTLEEARATEILIETDTTNFLVNEKSWTVTAGASTPVALKMLHASQIHDTFAELLAGMDCALPRFGESARLHMIMFDALEDILMVDGETPIT
ncbi:MAG: hypothetical protein GXP04_02355 [Alphaproteobacteria bacterium]|nr:hypothetical protein [Alphaproteobacteria bacterium]